MSAFWNWLRAKPWQGWHYRTIYRALRTGYRHPTEDRWMYGGEPRGRLGALWGAISFPHVHDDDEESALEFTGFRG